MESAHLRMGRLKFVRQTRDTITEVSLHMNRLVAEEIAAIAAAVADGQRVQVSLPGGPDVFGLFGEKPIIYRASLQLAGHKRPIRHLVVISQELFATTLGVDGQARRTILYEGSIEFTLHRLAVRFGLPALPEWAAWFQAHLLQ